MDDERQLVEALQRGDPQALDAFYRAYARTVLAWAIRLGGKGIDAEDAAQDVFAVAFRRIGSFRGEARLSTWLFSITRNVIYNARRRAIVRRMVTLESVPEPSSGHPGADHHVEVQQRRAQVQEALEQLKRAQREVLVLMDLEGRTAPEVADMLGIPPGTVYSRLHYARKAFTKVLDRIDAKDAAILSDHLPEVSR
jgi:RNA polymerase sigma-70 factor (ECF subfamily)